MVYIITRHFAISDGTVNVCDIRLYFLTSKPWVAKSRSFHCCEIIAPFLSMKCNPNLIIEFSVKASLPRSIDKVNFSSFLASRLNGSLDKPLNSPLGVPKICKPRPKCVIASSVRYSSPLFCKLLSSHLCKAFSKFELGK